MTISRLYLVFVLLLGSLGSGKTAEPDRFDQASVPTEVLPTDPKLIKIVLIAGVPTPGLRTGAHEYFAGCTVLMKLLRQTPGVFPVLVRDGWPTKPETLKGAKAIVLFLEGGNVHALLKGDRLQEVQEHLDAGAGIVHLHSAIDYPKDLGDRIRTWTGAAWEKGYSQRAHWVASFDTFPEHPICRGVAPFRIDDGWLWKLHFVEGMKGVTLLLRTSSPKVPVQASTSTEPIVSWAYERPSSGRSFTFTGCHLHESWKEDGYRKFLVNGILWSAGLKIPADGAPVVLDPKDLEKHLDTRTPAKK